MALETDRPEEDRLSDANDPVAHAANERLNSHGTDDFGEWQKELADQEENPDGFSYRPEKNIDNSDAGAKAATAAAIGGSEADADPGPGGSEKGLYNPSDKGRRFSFRFTRRQGIIGGIVGTLVGGGLFGTLLLSSPFQLIHISQLLSHNFTKSQSDSEDRSNHFLRDARAWREKDIRYTRIGGIASRLMNRALDQMEAKGLKVTGNDINGHPTALEIDHAKVKEAFPETKNMSPAEIDKWMGDRIGATESFKDGKLSIRGLKGQAIGKLLTNSSIKLLGDNKAVAAVKLRPVKKFFGLGSLFHPFSRALDNALSKAAAKAAEKRKEKQSTESDNAAKESALEADQALKEDPVTAPGEKAYNDFRDQHAGWKDKVVKGAGSAAGFAWVTGCTLRDSGKAIIAINRHLVVDPTVIEAAGIIAGGSQTQYSNADGGSDLTGQQVGTMLGSISGIMASPAMQAMNGEKGGTLNKNDSQQWDRYKAAYADPHFADNLVNIGNAILKYTGISETSSIIGTLTDWIPGSSVLGLSNPCSLTYAAGIVGIGLLQNAAALATCVGGCEGEALIQGVQRLVVYVVHTAESVVLTGAAVGVVEKELIANGTVPKLAKDVYKTPLGGELVASGARELGGLAARGAGGIALAGTATKTLVGTAGEEEQQQFRSESYATRLFNTSDYRSLTGQISMRIKPSVQQNIASMVSGLQNIGGNLGSIFSSLIPNASAASTTDSWSGNYDWGTPQYGIPDQMLNDPNLSDPYQNSETVGKYLSDNCKDGSDIGPDKGACGGDGGLTDRIMKCFGNTLTYQDGLWDVAPASNTDIDPNDPAYQNAHCADIQDAQVASVGNKQANLAAAQKCSSKQPQIRLASYSKTPANTITNASGCNSITTADASTGGTTSSWTRVVMFVNDSSTIKAEDCLVGNSDTANQSCADEGMDTTTSSTSDTASTGTATGDTASLAQQVLSNSNITLSASSKADLEAASQGQKVTPGPIGDGSSGLPGCSARTPTDLNPALLKVALSIAQKYAYQINNFVSGHDCDTGQHPLGRAMDIFYIAGKPLNDSWWSSGSNVATINDIGSIVHGVGNYQFGFGVGCTAVSKIQSQGNLVVFNDSCNPQDEIHLDVRGAP